MDLLIKNGASYHILRKADHQVNPGGEKGKCLESGRKPLQLSSYKPQRGIWLLQYGLIS
jgi:hypothetical protein